MKSVNSKSMKFISLEYLLINRVLIYITYIVL